MEFQMLDQEFWYGGAVYEGYMWDEYQSIQVHFVEC